jgi:hypothetical protein
LNWLDWSRSGLLGDDGFGNLDHWRRRRLGSLDDFDLLLNGGRLRFNGCGGSGFESGGDIRVGLDDFLFKILGGDLVKGAGGNFSGGNAQSFRSGKDFFVFQAELLRDFVNAYGHNYSTRTA